MIRKKKSIAVFLNINYKIVLSWLNCIYLCVFKNSLYHCFCQFLIKYTICLFPFISIFLYKQEKVFLKHFICKYTKCSLPSFVQFQRCWCSVALLYKHTIPKRLSSWEGGPHIYLSGWACGQMRGCHGYWPEPQARESFHGDWLSRFPRTPGGPWTRISSHPVRLVSRNHSKWLWWGTHHPWRWAFGC